jgi:hypothetical protein
MDIDSATPLPECHEGPEAATRFDSEMRFLLSVPRPLIERRARAYQKKSAANPNRRGPKPKIKPSALDHESSAEDQNASAV